MISEKLRKITQKIAVQHKDPYKIKDLKKELDKRRIHDKEISVEYNTYDDEIIISGDSGKKDAEIKKQIADMFKKLKLDKEYNLSRMKIDRFGKDNAFMVSIPK